jgi:hypothetical protein
MSNPKLSIMDDELKYLRKLIGREILEIRQPKTSEILEGRS